MKKVIKEYTLHIIKDSNYANQKDLIKLKFRENESNKYELLDKKEIKYDNKMFDIVKSEIIDGTAIYYCIEDKKEEAFDSLISSQEDSKGKDNSLIISYKIFVKNIVIQAIPIKCLIFPNYKLNDIFHSDLASFYRSPSLMKNYPPPRFLLSIL